MRSGSGRKRRRHESKKKQRFADYSKKKRQSLSACWNKKPDCPDVLFEPSTSAALPDDINVGDVIVGNLHVIEKHQTRPVIVWGVYTDGQSHVRAVDVVLSTTSWIGTRTGSIALDENSYTLSGMVRPHTIRLTDVFTLENKTEEQGGCFFEHTYRVGVVNSALFPDLIAHRTDALLYSPFSKWNIHAEIDPSWERKGIKLSHVRPENIKSGDLAPDIGGLDEDVFFASSIEPLVQIDPSDVRRVTLWAANHSARLRAESKPVTWPEIAKYPQWCDEALRMSAIPKYPSPQPAGA